MARTMKAMKGMKKKAATLPMKVMKKKAERKAMNVKKNDVAAMHMMKKKAAEEKKAAKKAIQEMKKKAMKKQKAMKKKKQKRKGKIFEIYTGGGMQSFFLEFKHPIPRKCCLKLWSTWIPDKKMKHLIERFKISLQNGSWVPDNM